MAERFYLNLPLAPGPVELSGAEAHHLAQVCRLRPGDPVTLFNGDGHEYPGRVRIAARRSVLVDVESVQTPQRELAFGLHIAAPLPKGDRLQFLIEKLTELGVSVFTPLLCERSVIEPREGKLEKLERYVIEACKQCGRNVILRIDPPTRWPDLVRRRCEFEQACVAHPCSGNRAPLAPRPGQHYCFAVGPEGGFTGDEVALAVAAGWQPFDLGPRILRIETAALVLAAWAGM